MTTLPLVSKLFDKEEFSQFANLHETFHCLDPYYIVKQATGNYTDTDIVHRAESFAEVGALLYLAGQGQTNLGELRAIYRIVGSFMAGRHSELLGRPVFSPMDDIDYGVVYSFYPAIFATQKLIDTGLGKLNLKNILHLAHQVVEDQAFKNYEAHAIRNYQANPQSLRKMISQIKKDDNLLLRDYFLKVEKALDEYLLILNWAFAELLIDSEL